jgi:hypothetical protein
MIMSLRVFEKQSPVREDCHVALRAPRNDRLLRGDCLPYGYDVATCARNDIAKVNVLRELHKGIMLQSQTGKELFESAAGNVFDA